MELYQPPLRDLTDEELKFCQRLKGNGLLKGLISGDLGNYNQADVQVWLEQRCDLHDICRHHNHPDE